MKKFTGILYCAKCGRANTENYNCCPECGSSDFVDYEKHLKLQKVDRAIKNRPVVVWAVIWELLFIAALIILIVMYVNTQNYYALGCIIGSSVIIAYTIYTVIVYSSYISSIESRQKFGADLECIEIAIWVVELICLFAGFFVGSKVFYTCEFCVYVSLAVSSFCKGFVMKRSSILTSKDYKMGEELFIFWFSLSEGFLSFMGILFW